MSYYQNYLKHYTKLNFYISQISVWIKSNQIDCIYHALLSAEKEIQFMYPILKELNYRAPESFEHALKNIAHELISEYRADTRLGIFDSHPHNPIDDQAFLLKLFKNHDLYQKRYDILERYLKIA